MILHRPRPSTFSFVALDPATGELGIAVQSKFLAVGAVVPWAQAGVGAIATQSYANTSYGPRGLALLAEGYTAQETVARLTQEDEERELRQLGVVSARRNAATFTGSGCYQWAGGIAGEQFCCQGNILVSGETVEAMASTFEARSGPLADKLLSALAAGQAAGGDRRGQQSASLLIVKEKGGYGGYNDIFLDLRVDDHPTPIDELTRLYELHKLYFEKSPQADLLRISPSLAREIQEALANLGYYSAQINGQYDERTEQALRDFCGTENLEERWQDKAYQDKAYQDKAYQDKAYQDKAYIDPQVLAFLRDKG